MHESCIHRFIIKFKDIGDLGLQTSYTYLPFGDTSVQFGNLDLPFGYLRIEN